MYKPNIKKEIKPSILAESHNIYEHFNYCIQEDNIHSYRQSTITTAISIILNNLISRRNLKNIPNRNNKYIKSNFNYMIISHNMNDYNIKTKKDINIFSENDCSYKDVMQALKILQEANIIKLIKNGRIYKRKYNENEDWKIKSSSMSRIYLNDISEWNKDYVSKNLLNITRSLFFNREDNSERTLVNLNIKNNKNNVLYKKTLEDDIRLKNINNFLIEKDLPDLCYQRNYNALNDSPERIGYGRLTSQFHQISKSHREIILKKYDLEEFDFKSCLINILFVLETGELYQGDIYNDAMNFCGIHNKFYSDYRDVFKKIFIILLNSYNYNNCKKAIHQILREYGLLKSKKDFNLLNNFQSNFSDKNNIIRYTFTAEEIIFIITNNFNILSNYFFTKTSEYTQFIESEICIRIMNIMINDNIIPLSIHDSFLFPKNDIDYYSIICNNIFIDVINTFKIKYAYIFDLQYNIISEGEREILYYNIKVPSFLKIKNNKLFYLKNRKTNFKKLFDLDDFDVGWI